MLSRFIVLSALAVTALSSPLYDYVIVGGGTSGLLLASVLSNNPAKTVAVLEAGGDARNDARVSNPQNEGGIQGTIYDWNFTSIPQKQLYNNAVIPVPRGKTLGGSSAMNFMIWHRASQIEFDAWQSTLNISGWNWSTIYAANKASESFTNSPAALAGNLTYNDAYHGFSGPVAGSMEKSVFSLYTDYVLPSLKSLGVSKLQDSDGGNTTGPRFVPLCINASTYTRSYSGSAYTNVQGRPNLVVLTNTTATRLLWGATYSGQAVSNAVEYIDPKTGTKNFINGSNIVLSAGAIQSPQLLELSGVGNPNILTPLGIKTVLNLPAVGTQAQDHLSYSGGFGFNKSDFTGGDYVQDFQDYAQPSRFLSAADYRNASQLLSGATPPAGVSNASWQMLKKLWATDQPMIEFGWFFGYVNAYLLHPLSQGTIHINSSSPLSAPRIDPNFNSAKTSGVEWDLWLLSKALQYYATTVAKSSPLSSIAAAYSVNGSLPFDQFQSTIYKGLSSGSHQTGGCVMMPQNQGGVVDSNLKVYGTKNVYVVDASVVPVSPGQHTMGLAWAIAMRAASLFGQT